MPVRRRVAALAVAAVTALLPLAGASTPAAAAGPVVKTFRYGTDSPSQALDAHYTPGRTGRPWVMLVHGGSWSGGDKAVMAWPSRVFTEAGFVVFNVNYRLSGEKAWNAQRVDVASAIQWVRARATTFGISPRRGSLYGFSAGGHIVSTLGTYGAGKNRIRAVVSVAGVNDPKRGWNYVHNPAAARAAGLEAHSSFGYVADRTEYLVRCSPVDATKACADRWADINPSRYASSDDAAFLILHGGADAAVPYTESQALHYYLWKARARTTYVKVPGVGHDQAKLVFGSPVRMRQVLNFLVTNTK